jgi:predicted O-methyltransferase YrrM
VSLHSFEQLATITDKVHFAAHIGKRLLDMPITPADIRGYLAPEEGLALMMLAEYGPGQGAVVEIGSFLGKSTCWLGLGAQSAGREKITAIDYFKPLSFMAESEDELDQTIVKEGSTFPFFVQHIKEFGLEDQVEPLVSDSATAAQTWDDRSIRLLFIDGHHEYDSVKKDFCLWSPFVQKGGIIVFHDYCEFWPGVVRYYDEMIAATDQYKELSTCYSLKIVVKCYIR